MIRITKTNLSAVLPLVFACLNIAHTQEAESIKAIEKTIQDYVKAMAAMDADGIRRVFNKNFIAVATGTPNAKVMVLDPAATIKPVPPQVNNEWKHVGGVSVNVDFCSTNPSVALANIVVLKSLTDEEVQKWKQWLAKIAPIDEEVQRWKELWPQRRGIIDEAKRKKVEELIVTRTTEISIFAMLARVDSQWKIVCVSIPRSHLPCYGGVF